MSTKITITEALAELTTIGKRVDKKRTFIKAYLMRQEKLKDPLVKDGGASEVIKREFQAVNDLLGRLISIRLAIQKKNHETDVTVGGVTKTLAEWLTWRKEAAPGEQRMYLELQQMINSARAQGLRQGATVVSAGQEAKPDDIVVNVDEAALARSAEETETVLGDLDGQLSLKNATVYIEV